MIVSKPKTIQTERTPETFEEKQLQIRNPASGAATKGRIPHRFLEEQEEWIRCRSAETGAPRCGTGVPARQIAENGLEITPGPNCRERCKQRPSNGLTPGQDPSELTDRAIDPVISSKAEENGSHLEVRRHVRKLLQRSPVANRAPLSPMALAVEHREFLLTTPTETRVRC